jgi:flavin-dependent dehydrogenase
MKSCDIIIIGGGPAGASAALFLEKKGYHITLLDQARFPRDKICGEFVSPAADDIFAELGILESIEALNPKRLSGVALSAYESSFLKVPYPLSPNGKTMTSLSMERSILDNLMVDHVRKSRVELMEGVKVTDLLFEDNNVCGVKGHDESKKRLNIRAKLVIDAGGKNSISLRRLNLKKKSFGRGKVALAAHWKGFKADSQYCYMHVSHPGYTGIAPVGSDKVNVVLVVNKNNLVKQNVDEFFIKIVLGNQLRRKFLADCFPIEKVRIIDSLSYSVKKPKCGGLLLVGDATGFIDPFTGEGIYLSLRSSQLAAEVTESAFNQSNFSNRNLATYDYLRRKEFQKKVILSKLLQRLIYSPFCCDRVIKMFATQKELSSLLVGVIGDYIPAERVVCCDYFIRILSGLIKQKAYSLKSKEGLLNRLTFLASSERKK